MRKALVRNVDGLVLNMIEHEDNSQWPLPIGCSLIPAATLGSPGDRWDGQRFIPALQMLPPDPTIAIAAAAADVVAEMSKTISLTATAKTTLENKLIVFATKIQGR